MSWVYEIALRGAPQASEALRTGLSSGPRQAFAALSGLTSFDLYTPAEGTPHDPYNHDGAGPLMMLMLEFASRDALSAAVNGGQSRRARRRCRAALARPARPSNGAFILSARPGRRRCARRSPMWCAIIVRPMTSRLHRKLSRHASGDPSQAAGIRTIMCYLPLDEVAKPRAAWRPADYMIGNEVVFDDIAAFNIAMASPVRQELRAHYREFPRFSGANTHFPMTRARLSA